MLTGPTLEGRTDTVPLAEVFWRIGFLRLTGCLALSQGSYKKELYFRQGAPFLARSTAPSESLTRYLLDRNLVDAARLEQAVQVSRTGRRSVTEVLLASRAMRTQDVEMALRGYLREMFLAAFRLRDATFLFRLDERGDNLPVVPEVDLLALLRDAVERHVRFDEVAATLAPWGEKAVVRTAAFYDVLSAASLLPEERRVVEAVDGKRSLGDLVMHLQADMAQFFPVLYLLRCIGLVRGADEPEWEARALEPAVAPAPVRAAPSVVPAGSGAISEPARATAAAPDPSPELAALVKKTLDEIGSGGPVPFEPTPSEGESDVEVDRAQIEQALQSDGFRLTRILGRGGWGYVFEAEQERLHRNVAIKLLSPQLPKGERFAERFAREARSAAKLSHPNVVAVYDCRETCGFTYMVMELVVGVTLRDLVAYCGPMGERDALWAMAEVCLALTHAHDRDILHRDVKPENVFLGHDMRIKLGDWGLAKSYTGADADITEGGWAMGTPNYISPEQLRASKDLDPRTDVYAAGATLFFLLTGRPPYAGPSVVDIMASHLIDPPPDPGGLNVDVSQATRDLVRRAMAKDPADRYQTAEKLRQAVVDLASGK